MEWLHQDPWARWCARRDGLPRGLRDSDLGTGTTGQGQPPRRRDREDPHLQAEEWHAHRRWRDRIAEFSRERGQRQGPEGHGLPQQGGSRSERHQWPRSMAVQAQPRLLAAQQGVQGDERYRGEEVGRERRPAEAAHQAEGRPARRRAGRPGCRGRRGCQATVGGHREAAERNPGKPQGHDVRILRRAREDHPHLAGGRRCPHEIRAEGNRRPPLRQDRIWPASLG